MSLLFGTAGRIGNDKALRQLQDFLLEGEEILLAFKVVRDVHALTTRRILSLNVQGVTGSKKELRTIPWSKISAFSIESAGTFDMDAELKLYVSGLAPIEIKLDKGTPFAEVQRVLAQQVAG